MRPLTSFAIGAVALATALPTAGVALAEGTTEPAAPPAAAATSVVELPLLGIPLTVSVTTDVGGGLLDVSLGQPDAPLSPPEGFVATQLRPGKVTFVNDATGVKVRVSGAHGRQRVEARAGALADISGPGSWTGDVFETGETTTVVFEVTTADDGGPNIVGVDVTAAPADVERTIGATERGSESDDDDGELEQWASARVEFSYLGQTRSLRITARVESGDDDDDPSAALKISLSKLQGRQVQTPDADGNYLWTGMLCNGDDASIAYTVVDGGVQVSATSPDADVRAEGHQAKVGFSRHERVSIKVVDDDGAVEVGISQRFACDRVVPEVNTDIAPGAGRGDDDHDDDDDRDEHHRGDDRDDDDRDDDDDDDHDDDDDDHDDDDDDDHDGERGDRGGDRGDGRDDD